MKLYIRQINSCLDCGHYKYEMVDGFYDNNCTLSEQTITEEQIRKSIPDWCKLENVQKANNHWHKFREEDDYEQRTTNNRLVFCHLLNKFYSRISGKLCRKANVSGRGIC